MDSTLDPAHADRRTKQFVIGTLCLLASATVVTLCVQALRGQMVTIEVKDVALTIVGVLSGMLIRTGVDPLPAKGTPTDPVTVQTAPEKPLETTPANDEPTQIAPVAVASQVPMNADMTPDATVTDHVVPEGINYPPVFVDSIEPGEVKPSE